MDAHVERVAAIAAQVRAFHAEKQPFRIYHGSTNTTRRSNRSAAVDVSALANVLSVSKHAKTALVEPNVPMDALVAATLAHGLLPPVVMEFPGITAGGGYAGTAGESSSYRHGYFEDTANWVEMVLADGEAVRASATEREDLFRGAAGVFGTLGVVTLLELRLVDAKPYVDLTYHRVGGIDDACAKLEELELDAGVQYLDGIMFAKDRGVVLSASFTGITAGKRLKRFSRARDNWFYVHAGEVCLAGAGTHTEVVPIADYLFRYDRGAFWTGRFAFKYFLTPFNRLTRMALDPWMHTRVMYHALHESGFMDRYVIQDTAVPYENAPEYMEYLSAEFGHYPLWLCPMRQDHRLKFKPKRVTSDRLLNFGVWGPGPTDRAEFVDFNRRLEQKVDQLCGKKWMYAQTFYSEEEFWRVFDRDRYDALRRKYKATSLPNVYDKVKAKQLAEAGPQTWAAWLLAFLWSIWPISGLWGVFQATFGGDYLRRPKRLPLSTL